MAAIALEPKKRTRALFLVWSLAVLGVIFAGLQQMEAYKSDKDHERKQDQLQGTLNLSLQKQEYTRGQLDTVAGIMGEVLGSVKQGDPSIRLLATGILKMLNTSRERPGEQQDQLRKKIADFIADLRASNLKARLSSAPANTEERRLIGRQFLNTYNGRCYEIAIEMEKRNMKSEGATLRLACGSIADFGQNSVDDVIGLSRQFASELP